MDTHTYIKYIYITEPLCYSAETNTTLKTDYTSVFKKASSRATPEPSRVPWFRPLSSAGSPHTPQPLQSCQGSAGTHSTRRTDPPHAVVSATCPPWACQAHRNMKLHAHTHTCLLWFVSVLPPPRFQSWKVQPPLRLCWELNRDMSEGFLSFGFHMNLGVPLISVLKRSSWIPRFNIRGCGHNYPAQKSRASSD